MNTGHILDSDRKFLLQSLRFYRRIDRYVEVLGLNLKDVETFKYDVEAVLYVTGRYKSFADSFILYHVGIIRSQFSKLSRACFKSANYTQKIGEELGIEVRPAFNAAAFSGLGLFNYCKN